MRRLLIPLAALGLAATGCGHTTSHDGSATADARVSGALVGIGGPPGAGPQHWSGTIHVLGTVDTVARTDGRAHFSVQLPAGRYRFTATSPSYDDGKALCTAPHPVRVAAHQQVQVQVICQLR
jgi:hypothetical protein